MVCWEWMLVVEMVGKLGRGGYDFVTVMLTSVEYCRVEVLIVG